MTNFPIALTGDPVDYSKVVARFVDTAQLSQGDLVYHDGAWRRVHSAGQPDFFKMVRKMVIGSTVADFPITQRFCRKSK